MFATLNLQFSTVDLGGETLEASVLAPDAGSGVDFADLLKLKVGAPLAGADAGGEILPQAGSDLPLQPISVELDALPGPAPDALPVEPGLSEAVTPMPDLQAAAEVPVDALVEGSPLPESADPIELTTLPLAVTPETKAPDLVTGAISARETLVVADSPRAMSRPVVAAPQPIAATDNARLAEPLVTAARPVAPPAAPASSEDVIVPVDQPRRLEPVPLAPLRATEASEFFKARPVVTKTVQVLNVPPNPQQLVQPAVSPAPVVAADATYATALQQATEAIPTPVRDAAWGDQVAERVIVMAGNQVKTAEIRLTPAELGPLRVQVSVEDGATNVSFQAQHAVTREAIEQALPRLRELLAENGLSLGQANVGEQGLAGRHRDDAPVAGRADTVEAEDVTLPRDEGPRSSGTGLVDTFV